ncbi:MAG: hypothetical protein H6657_02530 [Ardenticatenaceae bacterium]|nr:hypothetical protein [Ardenticatenaceae bacterium]
MPKQILISTLGLSPGVVTGAYFLLEREGYGRIDQIVAITSKSGSANVCKEMINATFDLLDERPDYLQLTAIQAETVHDAQMSQKFTDFVLKKLQEYGRSHDKLFINVSGGRKSMVAGTITAVQKFLALNPKRIDDVHVFHLELLDDSIEANGIVTNLSKLPFAERQLYMNPPVGVMSLIELPILPLLTKPRELWGTLFEYAVGAYLLEQPDFNNVRFHFYPAAWQGKKGLGEVDVYAVQTEPGEGWPYVLDRSRLLTLLTQRFNLGELYSLTWDLAIEPDEVGGDTRTLYAQNLISYLQRREILPDLLAACQEKRRKGAKEGEDTNWHTAVQQLPLLLVECKLREEQPENRPVTHKEVQKLVNKMQALQTAESRQVDGWLVSNTHLVEPEALELVQAHGVQLWQATLPANWQEMPDWPINQLTPIETLWA